MNTTQWFILVVMLSSLLGFRYPQWFDFGRFTAYDIVHKKAWWKLFTHLFLHADLMHLLLNVVVLFMFGVEIESYFQLWFPGKALFLYIFLLIGSGLFSSIYGLYKYRNAPNYHAVGVSGAVSAIIFAYIALNPAKPLRFIFLPTVDIPGFVIGIAYLAYSWYMARKKLDNIGHDAHFLGALFGMAFMFVLQPALFVQFWEVIGSFVP